ncbi:MAG: hypothetical protein FJ095_14335 [Deltaproteobacteria bacterium]|nr:hypothetical protein [Deltaproteobacteria bacterium]
MSDVERVRVLEELLARVRRNRRRAVRARESAAAAERDGRVEGVVAPKAVEPRWLEESRADVLDVVPPPAEPSTAEPSTVEPSTVEPSTVEPSTVEPSTVEPSTVEPLSTLPPMAEPLTIDPPTVDASALLETCTTPPGSDGEPGATDEEELTPPPRDASAYAIADDETDDEAATPPPISFRATIGPEGIRFEEVPGSTSNPFTPSLHALDAALALDAEFRHGQLLHEASTPIQAHPAAERRAEASDSGAETPTGGFAYARSEAVTPAGGFAYERSEAVTPVSEHETRRPLVDAPQHEVASDVGLVVSELPEAVSDVMQLASEISEIHSFLPSHAHEAGAVPGFGAVGEEAPLEGAPASQPRPLDDIGVSEDIFAMSGGWGAPFDQALEAHAALHFAEPLSFDDDHATPVPRRVDDEVPTNPPPPGEPVTLMPGALAGYESENAPFSQSPVPEAAASRVVARELQDTPLAGALGTALFSGEASDVVDYVSSRAVLSSDAFGSVLDVALSLRLR